MEFWKAIFSPFSVSRGMWLLMCWESWWMGDLTVHRDKRVWMYRVVGQNLAAITLRICKSHVAIATSAWRPILTDFGGFMASRGDLIVKRDAFYNTVNVNVAFACILTTNLQRKANTWNTEHVIRAIQKQVRLFLRAHNEIVTICESQGKCHDSISLIHYITDDTFSK